jgi:hypothetical protein
MVSLHRAAGGQLRGEGLFQPVSDAIGNKSLLHSEEKVAPRVLLGQGKTEGLARDFAAIPVFAIDRPNPIRAAALGSPVSSAGSVSGLTRIASGACKNEDLRVPEQPFNSTSGPRIAPIPRSPSSAGDYDLSAYPLVHTDPGGTLRRVHADAAGVKSFDCPDFIGDAKLEACLNDKGRLGPSDHGVAVSKVQTGLLRDGADLGPDGVDGKFGPATGQAVRDFKTRHKLGFTSFPDVGPGTMAKLDELCPAAPGPTPVPTPPTPPPAPTCAVPTNPDLSGSSFNPTTDGQTEVALKHPLDALKANSLATDALAAARSSGFAGLHLGPADAFRHCFWNCRMTQELGATRAEQFGTGHENSGPSSIPFDNQMDLHDNATGRSLAGLGVDCHAAAMTAVTTGKLRSIRGPDTTPQAVPRVPVTCIGPSDQPWP